MMPRKAESAQPIDGELELDEWRRSVTATEDLWCDRVLEIPISDSRSNNLRKRLEGDAPGIN